MPNMSRLLLLSGTSALLVSCSSFSTTQIDSRINEKTGEKTTVTTKATARTLFDSESTLAKFKASQTEKSQGAEVGSLTQSSQGSVSNIVEAVVGAAIKAATKP